MTTIALLVLRIGELIIIIIITLFQEDTIFGTSVSLASGIQLQLKTVSFVINK